MFVRVSKKSQGKVWIPKTNQKWFFVNLEKIENKNKINCCHICTVIHHQNKCKILMVTLVAKMIVEGFAQMITVLHGGGGRSFGTSKSYYVIYVRPPRNDSSPIMNYAC